MAVLTLPTALSTFIGQALRAAELGVTLEMDLEDIDTYRAHLDLPGPVDLTVESDDGRVRVTAGPLEVEHEDGEVVARLDLPGPDLEVSMADGKVSGPRLVADVPEVQLDDQAEVLGRSKRTVVRAVRSGSLDAVLERLLEREQAGRGRRAVVRAVQARLEAVQG